MKDLYVPNFKVPGRRGPSASMWITLVLCAAFPPAGLLLLWGKVRCPLRGKVWISAVSVAILVCELTLFLAWREQANYVQPEVPVTRTYGETGTSQAPAATNAPAPGMGQNGGGNAGGATGASGGADADPGEVIMPANPMG